MDGYRGVLFWMDGYCSYANYALWFGHCEWSPKVLCPKIIGRFRKPHPITRKVLVGLFYFMDMDMAKRFTDTSKWGKPFFQDLSPKLKLVWIYLCDNCDHAGIWDLNLKLLSFQIGFEVTLADLNAFGDKVSIEGDKVLIPSFVDFQYGVLNPSNRVHQSVIMRLEKYQNKPLISPLQGAKDKDKDKDKEKKGECEGEKPKRSGFDLEALYKLYPRKQGKAEGIARLKQMIKTDQDYQDFQRAIANYNNHLRKQQTEAQFIKHFSSFVGTMAKQTWRDWLDHDAGTTNTPKTVKISMSDEMLAMALGRGSDE